jgi:catechol 2,3-dioxygenase-like lactoylglutathione lyase family enzyme
VGQKNLDGKYLDIETYGNYLDVKITETAMSDTPFALAGIDHIVLRVRDVERARRFYEGALGCRLERQQAEIGLWQLRAGISLIDLVNVDGEIGQRGGAAPGSVGRNMDHVALAIRPFDRAALRAHLDAHGIDIEGEADSNYGATGDSPALYVRDPDGNMVELMGPGTR